MTVDELINQASVIVDSVSKSLDDVMKLALNTDIDNPTYDDMKSRKVFYNKYSDIVSLNSKMARELLSAHKLQLALKDIVYEISNNKSAQYNVINSYREKLNYQINRIKEKIEIVTEFKKSLERNLKFYDSLQYILTSYRMEE